jgi:periplasmic divalent cation tolerance protein
MEKIVQIQWTASSLEEARSIAKELVEKRWVACANLMSNIESFYIWQGKMETSHEVKVLLKTRASLFSKVLDFIKKKGSYQVPEVSEIVFEKGNSDYFDWVISSTSEFKQ